jgi:hypothetical protein
MTSVPRQIAHHRASRRSRVEGCEHLEVSPPQPLAHAALCRTCGDIIRGDEVCYYSPAHHTARVWLCESCAAAIIERWRHV